MQKCSCKSALFSEINGKDTDKYRFLIAKINLPSCGGATKDLSRSSLRPSVQPHGISWDVTLRPVTVFLLQISHRTLAGFARTSMRKRGWEVNQHKIQGSGTAVKFGGVIWSGEVCIVPEAVIGKAQAYPIPKDMKKVQASVEIQGFGKIFIPHLTQCLHLLCCLMKRGHVWDWVSEQRGSFRTVKILLKQIQALGISHTDKPFE